jgi:hypothetical protein
VRLSCCEVSTPVELHAAVVATAAANPMASMVLFTVGSFRADRLQR